MGRSRSIAIAALIATLMLLAGRRARADEPAAKANPPIEQPSLEQLLSRGKKALIAHDAKTAKRLFAEGVARAERGPQRWRMLLGLALSLELDGAVKKAVNNYRRFLAETRSAPLASTDKWSRKRKRALADVRRLERELLKVHARVDLQSDPSGASVILNGKATNLTTPAVLYLEGGSYQLRLQHADYRAAAFSLLLEPGQRPLVHRSLIKIEKPPTPTPDGAATPLRPAPTQTQPAAPFRAPVVATPAASTPFVVPGALTIAGGAAIVIASAALHRSALDDAAEIQALAPMAQNIPRDQQLRERVGLYQPLYLTGYILGGLALAGGVALIVVPLATNDATPREPQSASRTRGPEVSIGLQFDRLLVHGHF